MNKVVFLILLNLVLLSVNCLSQGITNEEKQRIIADLDSSDYMTRYWAIDAVGKYKIVEAVPKLESIFWQQEPQLQGYILKRLLSLNATNTYNLAKAFLDSIPNYDYQSTMITPLDLQIVATHILFSYEDYSTVEYVFQIIERDKPKNQIDPLAKSLLPQIIENVPDYEIQAKEELIYLVNNQNTRYSDRTLSLLYLSEVYGQEILPLIETSFTTDQDPIVRRSAFELLFLNNGPNLNQLLKDRLLSDPEPTIRYKLASTLLDSFGTPSDYIFVTEYLQNEPNYTIKSVIQFEIDIFQPPLPDSTKSTNDLLNNLFNYVDSVSFYTWLGDLQFKNDLQSILQSAKTNLQNGDSLACREDIKAFQDSVDFVYADSLNQDPRFVTIEGWKFLYWNAQYILDRLPEIPSSEGVSTYSIFATHGVWLEQNSEILSGNIGVNEISEPPFMDSGVELSIGISTETPAGYTIKANRIKVKQNATVNADVFYNELDNNGTITGSLNTPLELPLIATLPEFYTSTPGTENIVVPQNGEYTLTPGAYGDIQVKKNGKLIFTGGEYHINHFNGGDNNLLLFQSESEVRIKDKFDTGKGSYIGPEDTTTHNANEIIFYVEGINGNNGNLGATPKAAKVGINNTVKANFYVPNGTLWLRQNSELEGSFIGKDVDVGIGVTVKLNSAF